MMTRINFIITGLWLCSFANGLKAQALYGRDSVRGSRYCEILVIEGGPGKLMARVFNSFGCNDCPQGLWKCLNPAKLKDSLHALAIVLNGPRVFMMDYISQSNKPSALVNLGGIGMIERATVPISSSRIITRKAPPYKETEVKRSTEYIFFKRKRIYQIITESGLVYVMQSYSMQVDSTLTESGLEGIGSRLKLPAGWKFVVSIPDQDLVLKTQADGAAYVIQDDLMNTYQRTN